MSTHQVLIVEDHPLVATATAELIGRCGTAVRPVVAPNFSQAVTKLAEVGTDYFRIFLDLGVPGSCGLSLATEVLARGLHRRCCVISAMENLEYVDEIRAAGFLGYIFKSTPIVEFTLALSTILEGHPSFPPLAPSGRTSVLRLTRRQIQLLEALRMGLSSREAAQKLSLTTGTVNNYVAALLHLLEAGSRAQAVARALELGLLSTIRPLAKGEKYSGREVAPLP